MLSSFRLVALDLDGTIVDSAPDLNHCLGHSLDSVGLTRPSLADTRSWIGDGVEMLVRRALTAKRGSPPDEAEHRSALAAFKQCYQDHLFVLSKLYPGVPETLEALAAVGLRVGCATNKPARFARELLDLAGIGAYFEFVHGADSFKTKKPDPEPLSRAAEKFGIPPHQAVMVGDSPNDLDAAQAAGFEFVFAAYGYAPAEDPRLNAGLATIDSFTDLMQLLCGS